MTADSSPSALYDLWNWLDSAMIALIVSFMIGGACGWIACWFIGGRP